MFQTGILKTSQTEDGKPVLEFFPLCMVGISSDYVAAWSKQDGRLPFRCTVDDMIKISEVRLVLQNAPKWFILNRIYWKWN